MFRRRAALLQRSSKPAFRRVLAQSAIAEGGSLDMNGGPPAIDVDRVSYSYGTRRALKNVSLEVKEGEVFALVGPNGGGKTTLFRLISTLVPMQTGQIRIRGASVSEQLFDVRRQIGVVFQAPSLDRKLTVQENLEQQAALYGLAGADFSGRSQEMLRHLGLFERSGDLVETLSGGLRRRLDLARGMLHLPRVLLLDEPSTGLDPGVRSDLWQYLRALRAEYGTTILLTTHLLEEADRADRVGILHEGALVSLGSPQELRATVGGKSVLIDCSRPEELAARIRERFGCDAQVVDDQVRLAGSDEVGWPDRLMEAFPEQIEAVRLGKPTLEDVFIARTGHRFWQEVTG